MTRRTAFLPTTAAVVLLAGAALAQQTPATRHMRAVVADREVPLLRQLSPSQTLRLSIALPLRNESELDTLLGRLYDPKSPSYHHWLSVNAFTEHYGPSAADYQALLQFLKSNGMTVKATAANRFLVDVDASVEQINRVFHVTMGEYQHPMENRTFYAPDREPTLDFPVQVWHIEGLDNFSIPRPVLRRVSPQTVVRATSGSGPGGQFLGSDFRAAYYGGSALTGAGQSIGLYGLGYNISDVENYYNNVGQSFNPSVVQNYSTDGSTNSCGSGCDDGEPVIDIVSSLSMAPGVNSVIEYFGSSFMDTFNAMASANVAKQLSASILYSPADPSSEEPIFKEFAAQGQSFFSASGDSGAYNSSSVFEYPADDPYVTAVGGTDLATNGSGGSWQSETAWVGSSGGVNEQGFAIPSYQQIASVINSSNDGSTTLRNVPDVAAEGNTDNWFCANGQACTGGLGGTSFAAPRWAGFMALVNQQAANNGEASTGFLNTIIYGNMGANFHDITTGNNANSDTSNNAVTGYDLVTGWGSPNGQALIDEFAPPSGGNLNGAHILAPGSSPGLVLDDNSGSTASGNKIQIWDADQTGAQSWVFSNTGVQPAGYYNLAVSYGPYCATASGTSAGSLVLLEPCNGSSAQAWQPIPAGSGYNFHPANNANLCLDVQYSGTTEGTPVWVWGCDNTSAQVWSLK